MTAMNEVNNDKTKSQEEYSRDPGHSKPSMDLLGAVITAIYDFVQRGCHSRGQFFNQHKHS